MPSVTSEKQNPSSSRRRGAFSSAPSSRGGKPPLNVTIRSAGLDLRGFLVAGAPGDAGAPGRPAPGLVLCHGFPHGPGGAASSGHTYPELADHLSRETGWTVLSFNFRGTGESEGDFSLGGWVADVRAAIDFLVAGDTVSGVWLAGSSAGGAVCLCAAAEDERVKGVATLASPADFGDWAAEPERFLAHARQVGVVRDARFPADFETWSRELRETSPLLAVAKVPPRPLLLMHGTHDEVVPVHDARVLADATHDQAELRILADADHRLRHDPRAVAMLIGWMGRVVGPS